MLGFGKNWKSPKIQKNTGENKLGKIHKKNIKILQKTRKNTSET